jgi:hypothetical protein
MPWTYSGMLLLAIFSSTSLVLAGAPSAKKEPAQSSESPREVDSAKKAPSSSPGLTGKPHAGMFGIEAEGYKFVYVLDRSGSMGGSASVALKAAKAELLSSLQQLQQTQQFQIVFYNEKPTVFNPTGDSRRILFATDGNKEAAERFIQSITPTGGTRHDDALVLALKLQPNAIFWLTDADDPKLGTAELDRINRLSGGITIHAIEFGSGEQAEKDNFLVKVARENGGKHVYVDVSKLSEKPKAP